jgi:hypothetical protein
MPTAIDFRPFYEAGSVKSKGGSIGLTFYPVSGTPRKGDSGHSTVTDDGAYPSGRARGSKGQPGFRLVDRTSLCGVSESKPRLVAGSDSFGRCDFSSFGHCDFWSLGSSPAAHRGILAPHRGG